MIDQTHFISFVTAFETNTFTISAYTKQQVRNTDQEWQKLLEIHAVKFKNVYIHLLEGEEVAETEQKTVKRSRRVRIKAEFFLTIFGSEKNARKWWE